LNENFGSEADLKQLISEAKSKDIGIMVDVVSLDPGVFELTRRNKSDFG
jgi:glycosidase